MNLGPGRRGPIQPSHSQHPEMGWKHCWTLLLQRGKWKAQRSQHSTSETQPGRCWEFFKIRTQSCHCLGTWPYPLGSWLCFLSHPFFFSKRKTGFAVIKFAQLVVPVELWGSHCLCILYCLYLFQSNLGIFLPICLFFKFIVLLQILLKIYSIKQEP